MEIRGLEPRPQLHAGMELVDRLLGGAMAMSHLESTLLLNGGPFAQAREHVSAPLPSRAGSSDRDPRRSLALGHFRAWHPSEADRTLVTAADREVEAEWCPRWVRSARRGHHRRGGRRREGTGPYRIVLDPIDGTASFVAGLPTWCICIGILEGARPVPASSTCRRSTRRTPRSMASPT